MEPKIEKQIIERLGLERDFFVRNPAILYVDKKLIIGFKNWKLLLTRQEYEKLRSYLFWGCGACCGFGGEAVYEEGNLVAVEGIPCMCHADSWSWTAEIPWE